MPNLRTLNGLGSDCLRRLEKMGIRTTSQLLKKAAFPPERKQIAEKVDATPKDVLRWTVYCDFFRLEDMKTEYIRLFNKIGIDAPQLLGFCEPQELYERMKACSESGNNLPSLSQLEGWVRQAQDLRAVIWFEGMYCLGLGN